MKKAALTSRVAALEESERLRRLRQQTVGTPVSVDSDYKAAENGIHDDDDDVINKWHVLRSGKLRTLSIEVLGRKRRCTAGGRSGRR